MNGRDLLRYQPIAKERFTVEQTSTGEQIKIKTLRPIFQMLFLPIWLIGWTIGGGAAIREIINHFQLFLLVWLCMWAIGWLAVAGTLAWMLAGSETLKVIGSDLEIAHHVPGWSRRWLYKGTEICNLSATNQLGWPFRFNWQVPFLRVGQTGSIKFNYGPRTIYAAAGLDEAEGHVIVKRLLKHLPTADRQTP